MWATPWPPVLMSIRWLRFNWGNHLPGSLTLWGQTRHRGWRHSMGRWMRRIRRSWSSSSYRRSSVLVRVSSLITNCITSTWPWLSFLANHQWRRGRSCWVWLRWYSRVDSITRARSLTIWSRSSVWCMTRICLSGWEAMADLIKDIFQTQIQLI